MKTSLVLTCLILFAAFAPGLRAQNSDHLAGFGIRPIGNWQVDPTETAEINQIFSSAISAANSVPATPDMGAQRHQINNELRNELEAFIAAHPNSAYAPSLDIWLGNQAFLVCAA